MGGCRNLAVPPALADGVGAARRGHREEVTRARFGSCLVTIPWLHTRNLIRATWRHGEVAEWLKAPHSKCGVRVTVPGVRIPPSPPFLLRADARSFVFNCQTAKRNRPLSLCGRGVRPYFLLFFRPPNEGRWRAEQALNLGSVRQSARHAASSAICLVRVSDRGRLWCAHSVGSPEKRPGTGLRIPPAGAASRPTSMTPHEASPRGRDICNIGRRWNISRTNITYR
jgi:hypothetical protein